MEFGPKVSKKDVDDLDVNLDFSKIVFPLIRQVIPNMTAQDIVGVKPMPKNLNEMFKYSLKDYLKENKYKLTPSGMWVKTWKKFKVMVKIEGENFEVMVDNFPIRCGPYPLSEWRDGLSEANKQLVELICSK